MIRLAIIGAGSMAGEHATQFQALEGVELVAVCDVDGGRAQAFAARHAIPLPIPISRQCWPGRRSMR
ncbi:Gfo/Idh/MocA family oxidoreductase [Billgrantia tianxiuensis]|uniref:Gfo/Idh/MocA family oxidoreductase n=1 Tax=Billgrantia tianxiuensis TaxID=2497861 RepID=UPI001F407EA7|nr:Gfo/Idh/MocA family oxidoreductase [Halomonas tianxiuensis]